MSFAGSNGAGKTTFARKFLPKYAKCKNFVNADLIARFKSERGSALGPYHIEMALMGDMVWKSGK